MPEVVTLQSAPQPEGAAEKATAAPFAMVGYFDTPAQIYHACEALRDAGYKAFDAHTPFPVHGLEKAMGLAPSKLPWLTLGAGVTGGVAGFALQWWTMAVDYPLNISGKPFFAWQAYIPITFELTILFAALATFVGMWGMNLLPTFFHPVMQHPDFGRATDDKFFISVEAKDPLFDPAKTRRLLEEQGAQNILEVQP